MTSWQDNRVLQTYSCNFLVYETSPNLCNSSSVVISFLWSYFDLSRICDKKATGSESAMGWSRVQLQLAGSHPPDQALRQKQAKKTQTDKLEKGGKTNEEIETWAIVDWMGNFGEGDEVVALVQFEYAVALAHLQVHTLR